MNYNKAIKQSDTGMVIAEVFSVTSGKRVGLTFFHWPWFSQKMRLTRAHAWADKWINNCQAHCIERSATLK